MQNDKPPPAPPLAPSPPPPVRRRWWRLIGGLLFLAVCAALGALIAEELRSSRWQAHYLAPIAAEVGFTVEPGAADTMLRAPESGPYDIRLGYTQMPAFLGRLGERGFRVTHQARPSPRLVELSDLGLFPVYREKDSAGLTLLDCKAQPLHHARYPERTYADFDAVPPLLVATLLFIENRELLDARRPLLNPAVEWDRFARAAFDQALSLIDAQHGGHGGSTLATQIEKYRHSPEGRTVSREEKLRQMASASVRAYLGGAETLPARRDLVVHYLNTVPLSAKPGFGEVNGIGDGLWAWYGRDFDEINRLLAPAGTAEAGDDLAARALAYKQALSLMIAQRRPSHYLAGAARNLAALTDSHLRLLADAGIIQPALRDAALAAPLQLRDEVVVAPPQSFVTRKAVNALRTHLSAMLGVPRFYDLDRLDLTATSTLDGAVQRAVTTLLRELHDPARARELGLFGQRMFAEGQDPARVMLSFTLYERGADANLLRIQTDNYDQPFDINEGAKLDLGSTAKLRTLVTYLEILAELHAQYASLDPAGLRAARAPSDPLSRWALDYLSRAPDRSLAAMLEAAMDRRYSASPDEQFFTGGGLHRFENFSRTDNDKILPVREAFRHSVNLVFIRMMRDIVRYTVASNPASADIFEDPDDPRRREYLARFADREGRVFLAGFFRKYQGRSADEALARLAEGIQLNPRRLAVILRSIAPTANEAAFAADMRRLLEGGANLADADLRDYYTRFAIDRYSLPDRGYLAGVHPLELWLLGFLREHPGATLTQALEASGEERLAVYTWLFRTRHRNAQDVRIRSLLEVEAFIDIARRWRRLGYPFEALTPSYASSIGSSADRPAALAELVGILVNDGRRLPVQRIDTLHFAAGTPYEARLVRAPGHAEQVLPPEVAAVARAAMIDVATNGTARRLAGAFTAADGTPLAVGGKTGTGDHRYEVYGRGGQLVSSRVVTRSATLVFLIGDRFFGTLTAYVGEPHAAEYQFTSSLAVQLLARGIAPLLQPLLGNDAAGVESCASAL